ncbi:MAG: hypothetical protein K2X94_00590 [Amoebophilaceae bacterium]|nr:hypothetical protein [Amoebophilaceae bacterium]
MALYRVIIVLLLNVGCSHRSHYGVVEGRKSSDFFTSLMHKFKDNPSITPMIKVVGD